MQSPAKSGILQFYDDHGQKIQEEDRWLFHNDGISFSE